MQLSPMSNTSTAAQETLTIACHCCGLVQQLPPIPRGQQARCPRCHSGIRRRLGKPQWCLAFASSAAILYPFAIFLPIMEIERLGYHIESSIWSGCAQLLGNGYWFTGAVVVLCSLILPVCKILGLMLICRERFLRRRHRSLTYHVIELSGRWGMLDVMLVAVLVASVKLGSTVTIHFGPGLSIFCACVVMSLCASSFFDPHMIWKNRND